jgi:hypothetical protein
VGLRKACRRHVFIARHYVCGDGFKQNATVWQDGGDWVVRQMHLSMILWLAGGAFVIGVIVMGVVLRRDRAGDLGIGQLGVDDRIQRRLSRR